MRQTFERRLQKERPKEIKTVTDVDVKDLIQSRL